MTPLQTEVQRIQEVTRSIQAIQDVAEGLYQLAAEQRIPEPESVNVWFEFEKPKLAARWIINHDTCLVTCQANGYAKIDRLIPGYDQIVHLIEATCPQTADA
ncbi:hypothetical protein [Mucisphaera sp.]|uniref:hypothetical protein n=1 Tax=Mucisphaera sp. TaxID=2913024 RepID=UPI003D0DBD7C